jgi:hypothetical protein
MQANTVRWIRGLAVACSLVLAIGVAAYAVWRIDPWAERQRSTPASFTLDLASQWTVDPALVRYRQTGLIDVGMSQPRAMAVGQDDEIYVAGDRVVRVFDSEGRQQREIPLKGAPTSVAVAAASHVHPGRLYVGADGRVELFDADGQSAGVWDRFGQGAIIASIALSDSDVFVADAGNRVVLRFDGQGQLLGQIGAPDADRQMPGFVVPSAHFDLAVANNESLYIVNPGCRRVELYTFDGALQSFWGRAGSTIEDFFGCCNPAHLELLGDGRFLTSEKGIPRVKVYGADGQFQCVVAGPRELDVREKQLGDPRLPSAQRVYDIASDNQGRILVLDPATRQVRVFQYQEEGQEQSDAS